MGGLAMALVRALVALVFRPPMRMIPGVRIEQRK